MASHVHSFFINVLVLCQEIIILLEGKEYLPDNQQFHATSSGDDKAMKEPREDNRCTCNWLHIDQKVHYMRVQ